MKGIWDSLLQLLQIERRQVKCSLGSLLTLRRYAQEFYKQRIVSNAAFLEVENLVKIYSKSDGRHSVILNNVNLTVGKDKSIPVFSYLEDSGYTLLKIVTALEKATDASVRLDGKEIGKPSSKPLMAFHQYCFLL